MKICDLTQFYSPLSGGVKRYVHEKASFIRDQTSDEHVLIVPGAKTERKGDERCRTYSIRSPLISRSARYRALLDLRAVSEVLERERPDIIESSDPYQVGWKAISFGRTASVPVVAFYHSHFPEAYLRGASRWLGSRAGESLMAAAQRYVRKMYNRFAATLVPSEPLQRVLIEWGVRNTRLVPLGVNTGVFRPEPDDAAETRSSLRVPAGRTLLLYVGRLAPEKNTRVLFQAFDHLSVRRPGDFQLLVIGDGPERSALHEVQGRTEGMEWIQYCTDPAELARYYRAADVLVHPGTQETFGLVALESQACGTPVVGIRGSRLDGIILHDQNAWADANDPEALAAAIERFSQLDLGGLGRTSAARAASEYAWPRVFDRLFCIYREVCAIYTRSRS
ncbi:MAG TPA: glycosyltransferase [Chthoniobacterales bacterium]|nr:glycosyltransferase [Chthoniobacterales bacterium]